jgi:hypothetical protein
MPELLLLNIDKNDFTKLYRAAEKGDQDARVAIFHMCDAYADKELLCILCDSMDCHPLFTPRSKN